MKKFVVNLIIASVYEEYVTNIIDRILSRRIHGRFRYQMGKSNDFDRRLRYDGLSQGKTRSNYKQIV
jgi:hypothetical protein